jgi:hypothetical protein
MGLVEGDFTLLVSFILVNTPPCQNPNQENGSITKVELVQDEFVDPGPFKLRPFELASLLDPKSLEALSAFGGVDAILEVLGTHRTCGLTIVSRGSSDRPGASQRHDRMDEHPLSTIAVTAPHDVSLSMRQYTFRFLFAPACPALVCITPSHCRTPSMPMPAPVN